MRKVSGVEIVVSAETLEMPVMIAMTANKPSRPRPSAGASAPVSRLSPYSCSASAAAGSSTPPDSAPTHAHRRAASCNRRRAMRRNQRMPRAFGDVVEASLVEVGKVEHQAELVGARDQLLAQVRQSGADIRRGWKTKRHACAVFHSSKGSSSRQACSVFTR